ncbi:MAG: hypothetical protein ACI9E1_000540 [Cryomorphaceae bacterium]|jgi:hypothetical protein
MRQDAKFFLRKMSQLLKGLEGDLRATLLFAFSERRNVSIVENR